MGYDQRRPHDQGVHDLSQPPLQFASARCKLVLDVRQTWHMMKCSCTPYVAYKMQGMDIVNILTVCLIWA